MTGKIHIDGEIGSKVTIDTVKDEISLFPEATEFEVHITSGGGDVDEGYAIGGLIDQLRASGIKTVAKINALCASIATYIACSCDVVEMGSHGDFMIHLPTGTLTGNAEDLRRGAERLDRIKSELIDKYLRKVAKKGVTSQQLSAMIEKETSMSPEQAHQMGFIDVIPPKMKVAAFFDPKKFNNMEKALTKEEAKGLFEEWGKKFDNLFKKRFKNTAVTLADGSIIQSDAEDPNAIVGSSVTDETGAALPDGTYETADGYAMVVAGGKVASMDPAEKPEEEEMAKLKQENEALKQQLAAQSQAVAEQKKAVETVAQQLTEFKNLKADFEKLKNQTFGDPNPPVDAPDKKDAGKAKEIDPMIKQMGDQLGKAFTTSRFK